MTRQVDALARGIQRRWWLIAGLALLGGIVAVTANSVMTTTYEARTSILVGETLHGSQVDTRALEASRQIAQSYGDIITRRPVMEGVVDETGLPITWQQLADRVRVDLPADDPQLIVVTVAAPSPGEAEAIAGAVGERLLAVSSSEAAAQRREFEAAQLASLRQKIVATDERIAALAKQRDEARSPERRQNLQDQIDDQDELLADWQKNYADLAGLKPPDSASTSLEILEAAHASPTPVSPRKNRNVLLAAALGLMLAVPLVYLLELRRFPVAQEAQDASTEETSPPAPDTEPEHEADAYAAKAFSVRERA